MRIVELLRHGVGWTAVCTVGLLLGACHQSPPAASEAKQLPDQLTPGPSRSTTRWVAPNAGPARANSFANLLRELDPQEQAKVHGWYRRLGTPSMNDATPAQVAWMQARNYPMPADIARADSMSTADLKTAADTGNPTAQNLYLARLLVEYHRVYGSINGPSDPARYRDPNRRLLLHEINRSMPEILASGSPFAGYLFAARYRLMYPENTATNAATQLAGLVWASKFGDTRASRLLSTSAVQAVDAATAGAAMNLILKRAARANPRLFLIPPTPIPSIRH